MESSRRMAPGSTGLLRSRRRDVNLKPNRLLDKSSSRGMIYENEELRLRTININAEVERSQNDIKKLRRENEQLRREIWCLREECDRLEALLKQKEEEDEEYDEDDEEEGEEEEGGNSGSPSDRPQEPSRPQGKTRPLIEVDGLSVVPEETEDNSSTNRSTPATEPPLLENPDRRCEPYAGDLPTCLRVHCVHPYTAGFTVDTVLLPALTVPEVIECVAKSLGSTLSLDGVRLVPGSCYLSMAGPKELEELLSKGLEVRGAKPELHDLSQGTVVMALSGVPHNMTDSTLAHTISQFGPIIGYVERRLYRSVDTGERLVRIRPMASIPKRVYIEGQEISVRTLSHEEMAQLAMLPAKLVRANNLHVRLQTDGASGGTPAPQATPISRAHIFAFPPTAPPNSSTSSPSTTQSEADRSQSAPVMNTSQTSPSLGGRRGASDSEVTGTKRNKPPQRRSVRRGHSPSSSSEQDSPGKPPRRRASSIFRQRSHLLGETDHSERERSQSISSSKASVRKLSMTGRETGKLPWIGCWGNGCL